MSPATAVISECGLYRYLLGRGPSDVPYVLYVGLNPSTANALTEDATSRRFKAFAAAWGYGAYRTVNLAAYRATNPIEMSLAKDPIGPENDDWIDRSLADAAIVVACWGANCTLLGQRAPAVARRLMTKPLYCLGLTRDRHPRHPLYLPGNTPLSLFSQELKR